jgi:hypothetical protein
VLIGLKTVIGMATLAGWTLVQNTAAHNFNVYRRSDVPGGETSWTFTTSASTTTAAWWIMEVEDLDLDDPLDVSASTTSSANPQSTGTTTINSAFDTIAIATHHGSNTGGTAMGSYSAQTGGFTELAEAASSSAATNHCVAVSTQFPGNVGTFNSLATKTGTITTSGGSVVVLRSATSPTQSAIVYHTGFEFGTDAVAFNTGPSTGKIADGVIGTMGTAVLIQSGTRTGGVGSYVLRLVASAAETRISWSATGALPSSKDGAAVGVWVKVVSSTGTAVLAILRDSAANDMQLVYDTSTTKLGVRWNTGTVTYQAGTLATGTWAMVDLAMWGCKTTAKKMAWAVDGTAETALSNLSAGATVFSSVYLGRDAAQTVTAEYDDVRISMNRADHPLGNQQVMLLTVDPAGTPTISGTTANFNTFTANGSMAAWDATVARDALNEVPPTIGASADGVAQVTLAASDYMEFPMDTYTLAVSERFIAVRALCCGWAASGTAATIGFRGYDGTTEVTWFAAADPGFDNAATTAWLSYQWITTGRWTQAKLGALALRLGFSSDATPDIGAHVLYLEVVIGPAEVRQLFGDLATVYTDPGYEAVVSLSATAPTMGTGDTVIEYEESGTPTTVNVPEGTTVDELVDAPTAATVNRITAYWPPEPAP